MIVAVTSCRSLSCSHLVLIFQYPVLAVLYDPAEYKI